MVLRFSGSGSSGKNGGGTGDLYIEILVEPHKEFVRRGNDIYTETSIDPAMAVLGGEIDVNTVLGEVTLKIPNGTQPDTIFKLKDKGCPILGKSSRGDHYVKVGVEIPKKVSKKDKKVWESLRK